MKIKPMQVGAVIVGACLLSANGADLVTNGSFENYTGTLSANAQLLSASFSLDNWEYTAPSGAPSGTGVGLCTSSETAHFKNVANVKGEIACYFQKNCSLLQKITVTEAGTYWVSFRYAPRYDNSVYRDGRFYIEIDEAEVGHADCGQDTTFRTAVMETELSVGEHKLVIRHSNEFSTDGEKRSNSVIDGISITPKTNDLLFNGSFEDYMGVIPSNNHFVGPNVNAATNAAGWAGVSYGLSEAKSPFLEDGSGSPFEGSTALHFNGVGEISQNVKIPEDGTYEISFVYAPRNKNNYAGGRVNVWIGDENVGYADCDALTTKFRRCTIRVPMTAGSHVFKLTHTLDNPVNSGNTPCSAIDDVSIVKVDDGNILANGGFEDYIGTLSGIEAVFSDSIKVDTWKYEDNTGLATTNSNYLSNKSGNPYEGNVSLYFNGAHSVSQTVYVAETGDYDISFAYAPRDTTYYYGGRVNVWIDDAKVGYVDCDNTTAKFRRYMVRAQIAAGSHVFKLTHTLDNPRDLTRWTPCSAIDDVSLKAVDSLIMNGSFDMGTVGDDGWSMSTDGAYSNPGWVAAGQCGLARAGYPNGSPWASSRLSPTGKYSLFMHTANYKGRIHDAASAMQSFDVTTKGVYELRFSYASRPFDNYKGGKIYARVYKGEGTEGSLIYERSVTADSLTDFVEFVGNVKFHEPGKYTLQFYAPQPEYLASGENDRGVVIDNVSVEYAGKLPGLMIIFR